MVNHSYQVLCKPAGARCNMNCSYCYYLEKEPLSREQGLSRMPDKVLEQYIIQHFAACPDDPVAFAWHGGEPTLAGLDFFRKVIRFQERHLPPGKRFVNGIQTNGTILDEHWCRFLSGHQFSVGISIDGPREIHNRFRSRKNGQACYDETLAGFKLLKQWGVSTEILCVVHAANVDHPREVYRFLKGLGAVYISFLPLVVQAKGDEGKVTKESVPAGAFGRFLATVFDEWQEKDIGRLKIQVIEEALRTAFNQDHTLCIFKTTCGGVPVLEQNGDFYCCDHYVDPQHRIGNIAERPLADLLNDPAQLAFGKAKESTLPDYCRQCDVLDMCRGECPKNRFIETPGGAPGLNYLCPDYQQFFRHIRPFAEVLARTIDPVV